MGFERNWAGAQQAAPAIERRGISTSEIRVYHTTRRDARQQASRGAFPELRGLNDQGDFLRDTGDFRENRCKDVARTR